MNDICQEVMGFLESLRRELPGIFSGRQSRFPAAPKSRTSPASRPSAGPAVLPPLRRAEPGTGDLSESVGISRKKAGEIIKGRIESVGGSMGLEYGRVFIKDQKTLWASCSGKRNLNFNWRLAAAPPEILEYVVIPELCHLREMNHSKRFWSLVREACPDYKARKKWLRDHSRLLRNGRELLLPVTCNS